MSVCVSRQFKLRLPVPAVTQPLTQPLAGTRQARHDRTQGDLGDGGDLLVGQPFQLAEDDHLPELHGQFFHGPSVAIDERDTLVCLDGGGPGAERLQAVATAAETCGARVHVLSETGLGEPLSVFPLTVCVQRIALEVAEQVGADPDVFGYDVPGRKEAWTALTL